MENKLWHFLLCNHHVELFPMGSNLNLDHDTGYFYLGGFHGFPQIFWASARLDNMVQVLYRVLQEERTKLREGVPYVKLYRYNPKHLCPKLNGYWDNGQIRLWTSFGSMNDSCQLVSVSISARGCGILILLTLAWNAYPCMAGRQAGRQADKSCDVTAQHSSVMYSTSNPMYNYYKGARNFAVQINGFMSLTSYFDFKYRY